MTLDKFGRHITKHGKSSEDAASKSINFSNYMYFNVLLQFELEQLLNGKVILRSGNTYYAFPLEYGLIEKVRFFNVNTIDHIVTNINEKQISKDELKNFPLYLNDRLSFSCSTFHVTQNKDVQKRIAAEIIIKCPIKFEESLVKSEQAYHIPSERQKQ